MTLNALIYLPAVLLIYYLLPTRLRNGFLLVCSYAFYIFLGWEMLAEPVFGVTSILLACRPLALALGLTVIDYFLARGIGRYRAEKKGRQLLTLGIVLHVLTLALFKFFTPVALLFVKVPQNQPELFPRLFGIVGLSYFTFQAIGYFIDIRNGKIEPESNFIVHSLYLSFFPQLTAGPIGRSTALIPQYHKPREWNYGDTVDGLQRILLGLFKSLAVSAGMQHVATLLLDKDTLFEKSSLAVLCGCVCYVFYVYANFAGYSDIAVGTARLFGISLAENFRAPFFATGMADYWQRWHISLSSWLADYVFTPLVWSRWWNRLFFGKRADEHNPHILANLILVFLISGIWHGSALGYLVWGLLHGVFRVMEELLERRRKAKKLGRKKLGPVETFLRRLGVFTATLVTLIFFREDFSHSLKIVTGLFNGNLGRTVDQIKTAFLEIFPSLSWYSLAFAALVLFSTALMLLGDWTTARLPKNAPNPQNQLCRLSPKLRWLLYYGLIALVILFFMVAVHGQFDLDPQYKGY